MARTKQEIRNFLNSTVGQSVNAKAGRYQGQCVSEIKALLEFLGVANPYAPRGNATDVGNTLVRQNIAENGKGWLTVVVNHDMGYIGGVHYGHVWIDLKGEANYEQNGHQALHVTKNTRPISQGQQFVTLDKYIKPDVPRKSNTVIAHEVIAGAWGNGEDRKRRLHAAGYDYNAIQSLVDKLVHPAAQPHTKMSNEVIAQQVINGAWGVGDDRKKRLTAAGYNYAAVQAIVNSLMGTGVAGKKSNEQVANEVIAGKWGNGPERKSRLQAAGYNYTTIQSIVNKHLGY